MLTSVERLLEYSWQIANTVEREATKSQIYLEIASAFLEQDQKSKCGEILAEVLKTIDTLKRPDEKAWLLAQAARTYAKLGDVTQTKELFNRAILLSRATETATLKAETLYRIAVEYADAGLNDEAAQILDELHEMVIIPGSNLDMVSELIGLAQLYQDIEQPDKARGILEEALEVTESLKDTWFKSQRLIEIAEEKINLGDEEEAEILLEKALSQANLVAEENRFYFLLTIVDLYTALDKKSRALEVLTSTLGIVIRFDPAESKVDDLIEIAKRYLQLGDKQQSTGLLSQAADLAGNFESLGDKMSSFIKIARQLKELGEEEKALQAANQAQDLCSAIENKRTLIYLLGDLALLYTQLDNRDQAAQIISQMASLVQKTPIKTSGLGPIAVELAEEGEIEMALRVAAMIHESEAKTRAILSIARSIAETGKEPQGETERLIGEVIGWS